MKLIMDKKGVYIDPFVRKFSENVEKLLKKRRSTAMGRKYNKNSCC